jgi:hypothetical protein
MISYVFLISIFAYTPQSLPIQVAKHSTWLGFKMKNIHKMNKLVPPNTEVAPIKILKDSKAEPKLLFNVYEAKSNFFNGKRFEVVTVVRQKKDHRKIHFVVLDCFTNTLSWDPKSGIQLPNVEKSILKMRNKNKIQIDWTCEDEIFLKATGKLQNTRRITKNFAIDANLFCFFQDSLNGVSLQFDEDEVMKDVRLMVNTKVDTNVWDEFRGHLTHAFIHLHKMDFWADMTHFEDFC